MEKQRAASEMAGLAESVPARSAASRLRPRGLVCAVVVGLGDTWPGGDASVVSRMARGAMGRANDEALTVKPHGLDAQRRAEVRAQHGKATGVSWRSAGSHKDENGISWRVAVGGATREPGYQRRESLGAVLWACVPR